MTRPTVLVFAGPNGSGKTTATRDTPLQGAYVNADDIKAESGCTDLESAQQATALREKLSTSVTKSLTGSSTRAKRTSSSTSTWKTPAAPPRKVTNIQGMPPGARTRPTAPVTPGP
jgi:predicted ABC-type ATPase